MNFTVETRDFLATLRADAPHAFPKADFTHLHRVRISVGGENVTVSATNGATGAMAIASVWDNGDGEVGDFDIAPSEAKAIATLFRVPAKKPSDDEPEQQLRIEVGDEHLTITDASGLFDGIALQLGRYPSDANMPPVTTRIASLIDGPQRKGPQPPDRLVASGHLLALFAKASAVYGAPLVIDQWSASSVLIACSDSFLGMLIPHRLDEENLAKITGFRLDWAARFAGATAQQELTS